MTTARADLTPAVRLGAVGRGMGTGGAWAATAINTAVLFGAVLAALIPVGFLLFYSFDASSFGQPYSFGVGPWLAVLAEPANLRSIIDSFVLSLRSVVGVAIALAISWCIVRLSLPGRRFIEIALWFGFFMPPIPVAMAWLLLLNPSYGLINHALAGVPFLSGLHLSVQSIPGIMWVHLTITTVPFLTLILTPVVRQFDATYEEAARASGATWSYAARRITLPLLAPALLAGFIANYVKVFEFFEVEQLLGTPVGIYVFATRVYDLVNAEIPRFAEGMALASFLLFLVSALALVHHRFSRERPEAPTLGPQGFRRTQTLRPVVRWTVAAVIVTFVLVSVALPVAVVVVGSFAKLFGFFSIPDPWTLDHWATVLGDQRFARALTNSVIAGIGVGVVSVSLFFWLAWLLVRGKVKGRALAGELFWLPWALPGFVLGLAMLWIMLRFDAVAWLYGTFVPVLIVLAIKELPIGVHFFKVAIEQLRSAA